MAFGSSSYGKIIEIETRMKGINTAKRQVREFKKEMGGFVTATRTLDKQGNVLKETFVRQKTALDKFKGSLTGTMAKFVGVAAAMGMAFKAFNTLKDFIGEGIQKFREFEKAIAEVSTIISDMSRGDIYNLKAGIESLSVSFGKSVTDLSKGMYDILSAAIGAENSMRLLTTATKASIAGLTSVSTSVDVFTSILKSYGKTVSQAAYISDVLFQSVIRGKFTFDEFAHALGYITPIAANAGVAFNEIAAALSTVTRMGLHLDMATRGLALAIQNIVSPTKQASEAAMKYSIDMSAVALRVKGLTGFIKELSEKTKIYGTKIIPQIIRNMRSLRVIMALAGEEGIQGFIEDLKLLDSASGKTQEAMTKMMNVQQMQVDILEQSMNKIQRSLGKAWSGVDIWFKKAQLWWGTLLSGGNASKAVEDFEKYTYRIRRSYLELMKTQSEFRGKPRLLNLLIGDEGETAHTAEEIQNIINNAADFSKIADYLGMAKKAFDVSSEISEAATAVERFRLAYDEYVMGDVKKTKELALAFDEVAKHIPIEKIKDVANETDILGTIISALTLNMRLAWTSGSALVDTLSGSYGRAAKDITDWVKEAGGMNKVMSAMDTIIDGMTQDLEVYNTTMQALQPYYDYWAGGLDDLSETINTHRENILELTNAIEELRLEVETPLESLYSKMHPEDAINYKGQLGYKIEIAKRDRDFSRSQMYTNMAMKYGSKYINEYNDNLKDAILTIYNYSKSLDDAKKEQNKYNDKIKEYQLLSMKIELKGMMRRRGNTRKEMLEQKKLQIKMLEERIKIAENATMKEVDVKKDGVEEAKQIISEYYDKEKLTLWELKDVRDSEIEILESQYEYKKDMLNDYIGMKISETHKMETAEYAYLAALRAVNPEIAQLMEDTYGIKIPKSIQKAINKLMEYRRLSGVELSEPIKSAARLTPKESIEIKIDTIRESLKNKFPNLPFAKNTTSISGLQRGTEFVPKTSLYQLHMGERIIPPGKTNNNNNIVINASITVNMEGNRIPSDIIAREIEESIKRGVIRGVETSWR